MATSKEDKGILTARKIVFKTSFEGSADKTPEVMAYFFDRTGQLKAAVPLRDGQAELPVSDIRGGRVFFAPAFPKEEGKDQKITLKEMAFVQAYEPVWRYEKNKRVYEVAPIPSLRWPNWFWRRCRVRGRVIKRVNVGGVIYELPVVGARVHIDEVDKFQFIIPRIPEEWVFRLRDDLLKELDTPRIRGPWPPPEPDPWWRIAGERVQPGARIMGEKQTAAFAASVFGGQEVSINPQPEPPGLPLKANVRPMLQTLPAEAQVRLMSASVGAVRETLIDNIAILQPYLCALSWLHPYIYLREALASVITDAHGQFDTDIWYCILGDHPDLYFWVDYPIDGVWTEVYKPPVACNTYWDYECGREVTIRITDPRVPGTWEHEEVVGKKLVVKSIGRQVSMSEINRASVPAEAAKEGTVKAGWIHATKESPFGGILEPRVDFGTGLKTQGVTHYRWSYRSADSTSESDWTPIAAEVRRHYRVATAPGDPVRYWFVRLGPDPSTGLFEIEPELPADGEDWVVLDEGADLASAFFDTRSLSAGKYELKLELFKNVGGTMQRIDFSTEGVEVYEMADPAPFVVGEVHTAAPTSDRLLTMMVAGFPRTMGYRLVVHVDNRSCFGNILNVTAGGIGAGICGFLMYRDGDNAQISFQASHPGNFAWFDFDVTRVTTPVPEASATGLVQSGTVEGFIRVGDTFSKDVPVSTLMSSGWSPSPELPRPCVRAAFAEVLRVYALATNGYERLRYLDAPWAPEATPAQVGVRAFALTQ